MSNSSAIPCPHYLTKNGTGCYRNQNTWIVITRPYVKPVSGYSFWAVVLSLNEYYWVNIQDTGLRENIQGIGSL